MEWWGKTGIMEYWNDGMMGKEWNGGMLDNGIGSDQCSINNEKTHNLKGID